MKKNYATPAQILNAFETLSDADLLAIRKVAQRYIQGTRYSEPADIIHEVLHRCLNGTRHWPMGIPFPAFMNETMKSLAHAERTAIENNRVIYVDASEAPEALDHELMMAHIGFMAPDDAYEQKQHQALNKSKIDGLKQEFSNDPIAKILINAWANNVQPKDILSEYRITPKDYDAARKRIARRIEAKHSRRLQ